ncbi:hypothetical protein [Nostoc sp.]|uniref:hypothetical protein n=1 Tax=Nostoc sp. TaxID=1180 RepID=UPI002FFD482A
MDFRKFYIPTVNVSRRNFAKIFTAGSVSFLSAIYTKPILSSPKPPSLKYLYNFSVDSFMITNTRSRHEDTDFIAASVAVAGRPTRSASQSLGDLNNGTYPTAIMFKDIEVGENETAVFTYNIVNNGHSDPSTVEKTLIEGTKTLATKGAELAAKAAGPAIGAALGASIGTGVVPLIGTALGALAGWVVSYGGDLLFANCDGAVASAVHTFSGKQLREGTKQVGKLSDTDYHEGKESPDGCGGNSKYYVNWTIKLGRVIAVNEGVAPPSTAQGLLQALQAINIDYSLTEFQILDWLGNSYSLYPQFAKGILKFLDTQQLKNKVYLDVIFYNYKELGGKVVSNSLDGSLDSEILKKAIVEGYETRNGISVLSFEDIVKLRP